MWWWQLSSYSCKCSFHCLGGFTLAFEGSIRYLSGRHVFDVMRVSQILSQLCLQSSVAYLAASSVRAAICNLSFQLCFCLFHLCMSDRRASHKWGRLMSICVICEVVLSCRVVAITSVRSTCVHVLMSSILEEGSSDLHSRNLWTLLRCAWYIYIL